MRNRIMVVGVVLGLLAAGNVQASSMMMPVQQYATSQLELNPVLLNQNTVKPAAKTPAQTKNINYTQTKTYTQKALSEQKKDLQIDGRIEKTQQDKLYTNQSDAEMQRMVNTIGRKLTSTNTKIPRHIGSSLFSL